MMILEMILALFMIGFVLKIGFALFGAMLSVLGACLMAVFWCAVRLPLALFFYALGTVLCASIILIPFGLMSFRLGTDILI